MMGHERALLGARHDRNLRSGSTLHCGARAIMPASSAAGSKRTRGTCTVLTFLNVICCHDCSNKCVSPCSLTLRLTEDACDVRRFRETRQGRRTQKEDAPQIR